jgi:hypothetical protein
MGLLLRKKRPFVESSDAVIATRIESMEDFIEENDPESPRNMISKDGRVQYLLEPQMPTSTR